MSPSSTNVLIYRVKKIRLVGDIIAVRPVLLRGSTPLIFPNLWVIDVASPTKVNTIQSYLEDLIPLYEWADGRGLCLFKRFKDFQSLSASEVRSLIARLSDRKDGGKVSWKTFLRRLISARQFLSWLFDWHLDPLSHSESVLYTGQKRKEQLDRRLLRGGRNSAIPNATRPAATIQPARLEQIAATLHPVSGARIFKLDAVSKRNYVLFQTLRETWARRGEVVLLETDDLYLGSEPSIRFKDPSDSNKAKRKDGASKKTRGRVFPISGALSRDLDDYLETARNDLRKPRVITKALFLSARDGQRLGAKTVNQILKKVALHLAESATQGQGQTRDSLRLHPHALRKAGANDFRQQQPEGGGALAEAEIRDSMTYLAGWSEKSTMPAHYAQEALQKRVSEKIRKGIR